MSVTLFQDPSRKSRGRALLAVGVCLLSFSCGACSPRIEVERPEPGDDSGTGHSGSEHSGQLFATASEAFEKLLRMEPNAEVIGLGEYHQLKGAATVPSSLKRFTYDLLPRMRGRATDLILETWVADDSCGQKGQRVVEDVQKTIQRPSSTELEIVEMIRTARSVNIHPHILKLACSDHDAVFAGADVDYDRLLRVLARLLGDKVVYVRGRRERAGGPSRSRPYVLVYGGHIHNDLHPEAETAGYSYGPELSRAVKGRFLELDLFVPEYIEADKHLKRQSWFPEFLERQSEEQVLLLKRAESSYVLVFKRGRAAIERPEAP